MKHKKLIMAIIAVVVLAAAIGLAGVAFGWWTALATNGTNNAVSTGTAGLAMSGNPINLGGLVPRWPQQLTQQGLLRTATTGP